MWHGRQVFVGGNHFDLISLSICEICLFLEVLPAVVASNLLLVNVLVFTWNFVDKIMR